MELLPPPVSEPIEADVPSDSPSETAAGRSPPSLETFRGGELAAGEVSVEDCVDSIGSRVPGREFFLVAPSFWSLVSFSRLPVTPSLISFPGVAVTPSLMSSSGDSVTVDRLLLSGFEDVKKLDVFVFPPVELPAPSDFELLDGVKLAFFVIKRGALDEEVPLETPALLVSLRYSKYVGV